jgi:hypothetical protein
VNFVFLMLHHPPYTSCSEAKKFAEDAQALGRMPEEWQVGLACILCFFDVHILTSAAKSATSSRMEERFMLIPSTVPLLLN